MRSRPITETAQVSDRFTKPRRRARGASTIRGAGRLLHLFGALAMVLGLFLPLTEAGRALASPTQPDPFVLTQSQDVNTTSFTQVAAVGDFQGQFGCNGFDITCPATQLTNHDGIWTGVFAIPAGQWQWQIAAMTQAGEQIVLSDQGIDETSSITIVDTDAGAWFRFDALRQEANATTVAQIATLATDSGTFALEPDNGNFTAIIQSQGAPINAELQLGGAPVGNPQVIQAEQGAVQVTVDPSGNIVDTGNLGYATLTITRVDGATGQPLPGGCYEIRDGNTVINRGCDSDDGAADGSLTLMFPEGLDPDTYTVAEVMAPDGAEQAPDQDVQLQQTDNQIEISTGEPEETAAPTATKGTGGIVPIPGDEDTPEATQTPTSEAQTPEEQGAPGDLIVTLQDQANTPIGGACFQLIQNGQVQAESCDINDAFPNNGNTGFFGVPSGTYTLHQSTTPEGMQPVPDQQVQIPAGDEDTVVIQAAAPAEPTPESTGDIVVLRQDTNGNPVGGACFQLLDSSGQPVGVPVCDEDGDVADDGRIGFSGVPAGTYTLHETRTPDGVQPAADVQVDVTSDQTTQAPVQSALIPAEVPTETPTEAPTLAPTATTETVTPTEEASPTEVPTEETTAPGDLIITLQDQANAPIGGACFELHQGDTVLGPICDSDDPFPDNGNTGFFGVPSGTYTLHQSTVPEGTQAVPDQDVTVPSGDSDTVVVHAPAEAEPTTEASPTEVPTETDVPATGGNVVVDVPQAVAAEGDVCVELNTTGGIGMLNAPGACNNEQSDAAPASDQIEIKDVPAGSYAMTVTEGPDELVNSDPQPVTVVQGQTAQVALEGAPEPAPEPGILPVIAIAADGTKLPGACWTLSNDIYNSGSLCDNGANGGTDSDGQVQFEGLDAGNYTLTEDQAPAGYQKVDPVPVVVAAGENSAVTVTHEVATATVTITTQDSNGTVLPGACYTIDGGTPVCDGDDADGIVTIDGVASGDHSVSQTTPPSGYQQAEDQPLPVTPGTPASLTFQNAPVTESVVITTTNAAGDILPGACYTVDGGDPVCDGDDADGIVNVDGVPLGDHTIVQSTTPAGYQPAADQPVTVTADGPLNVAFENVAQTGTVTITTTDPAGNALPGACYAIEGGDPVCDGDDADGVVTIDGVSLGDHTVSQTTAPDGYQAAADQPVTVTDEGPATLTIQAVPQVGSLTLEVVGPDNEPLTDVCYTIDDGPQQCTGQNQGVASVANGAIVIDGIPVGEHTVTLQSVPEGFELPPAPMTTTVQAGTGTTIRFALDRVAPTTGGLDVTVQMDTEAPVPHVCVVLTNTGDSSVLGPFCDTGDQPGTIAIDDVPVGAWIVSLADDTEIPGGDVANADAPSVQILPGQRSTALITVPSVPTTGTIQLVTTDGSVNLAGACYDLTSGDTTISVCDNDNTTDNDGTNGVIEILDVAPGTWTVTMTTAPDGYTPAAATETTVASGETKTVEVTVTAIPQPGSLTITKLDEAGNPLGGACFALTQNGQTIQSICDANDDTPNDGVMTISGLDAGAYQLVETRAPSNAYQEAEQQPVEIVAGQETTVDVTNVARPGSLSIITVQDSDRTQRLDNACYRLEGESVLGPFCDADDGNVDGRVSFVNVAAGDYSLVQTVAPAGYDVAPNRAITITAGSSLQVTVANALTPPPAEAGTLAVIPLDEGGAPVAGGCYQVLDGDTPVTGRVCDNADDVDKRITFENLPVGTYTVRELLAPSPDYETAPDQEVTIRLNETTEVQFAHVLKAGRVLVQSVNSLGQPLQGACFDLANDGQDPACSGTAGEVLFSNVPAGTDSLKQTQAPAGYKLNDQAREVTVSPGQTTVIRVVLETAPPPDSGSVQVQKFICPAGEDGERTQFLGGAQGNAQLAKTAGCVQGEAAFTLVAEDGSGNGPGAFSTGSDGRYQVTVKQGIYVLTETDPDLPGSSAARLRVGVGQMTTVIVINSIAPPKPVPTNIEVTSYTCPPSFNGTSYADFAASCTSEQAKTNNLTVRVEGAAKYKQVTGDHGTLGTTTFTDLPAGKYVVYGEKPYNVPIMYLFCGTNAADPSDVKAINGSVPVTLQSAQTITCQFFQVPEQLSKDTGGILVQKFSCAIDKPAKGYDWANECERSAEQVPFSLAIFNKEMQDFESLGQVAANPDGLVRFTNLTPGTYKLEEVGAKWCFAQSNSVNADGNVVVQPNKLSEVWIYNCVGTSQPPNTGSGDAAALLNPPGEGNTGAMVLLNLAWPAIALAAWFGWRNRHGAHAPAIIHHHGDRAA